MKQTLAISLLSLFALSSCNNDDAKIDKLEQKLEQQSSEIQKQKEDGLKSELDAKNQELENLKSQAANTTAPTTTSSSSSNQDANYNAKGKGKYPQASTKIMYLADLVDLSKKELKIMRNEIYARHGYIFTSSDMKAHFNAQSWYKPLHKDVTNKLTQLEKENIELIEVYER